MMTTKAISYLGENIFELLTDTLQFFLSIIANSFKFRYDDYRNLPRTSRHFYNLAI